jgi:hypothetical protein
MSDEELWGGARGRRQRFPDREATSRLILLPLAVAFGLWIAVYSPDRYLLGPHAFLGALICIAVVTPLMRRRLI